MEKLLTLQEVNTVLGRKDKKCRFVQELRRKGILEGAYIGSKLVFRESDVSRYISNEFRKQNKKVCLEVDTHKG